MELFGFDVPVWLLLTTACLLLAYIYGTWTHDLFSKIGIPGPKPLPIFGNTIGLLTKGFRDFDREVMKKHGKIVGIFEGRNPLLMVSDPEALKQILVQDFHSFVNRRLADNIGPPFDMILPNLRNDQWRRVRNLLTPTFSTGKLKQMMGQMNICAQWMVEYIKTRAEKKEYIDMRKCGGAYSMDVIASTAFGVETNSLRNPDDKFVGHVQNIFKPRIILFLLFFTLPKLIKILREKFGINVFAPEATNFFRAIIEKLIADRKAGKAGDRVDFMQLMMNAHAEEQQLDSKDLEQDRSMGVEYDPTQRYKKAMTREELVAQAFIFFAAGSETTGGTLTFFGYAMATNPEVQEKLIAEIDDVVGDKVTITTEMLENMPYLEMCLSESLRLYNPAIRLERMANEDVEIKGFKIPKGTVINVPVDYIHHDPDIWPDPEKFDPERFSPENKPNIPSMGYIPFGFGPRNCIGMRLALLEVKIAIIRMLQNFRFKTCDKTPIPMVYNNAGLLQPKGPVYLNVESRAE